MYNIALDLSYHMVDLPNAVYEGPHACTHTKHTRSMRAYSFYNVYTKTLTHVYLHKYTNLFVHQ